MGRWMTCAAPAVVPGPRCEAGSHTDIRPEAQSGQDSLQDPRGNHRGLQLGTRVCKAHGSTGGGSGYMEGPRCGSHREQGGEEGTTELSRVTSAHAVRMDARRGADALGEGRRASEVGSRRDEQRQGRGFGGPEPLISIDLCPLHSHHAGQQNVPWKSAAARACGIQ